MKREIIITISLVLSLLVNAQETSNRPKIGLVLSGGGAKGFAHVGALKVIEEAGIPIDYITGTSIGSIVGGLYALGYDAATLEKVVVNQNWTMLLSNSNIRKFVPAILKEEQARYVISLPIESNKISIPDGFLNGQNTMDLLTDLCYPYHDDCDFTKLPIPFKCIAADISTGEEIVLDKGFLPKAMRASMAVPAAFSPVELNGRLLVDGGLVNNFPVDRCREMGADIIIGIDIGDSLLKKDKIKSIADIITQLTILTGIERSKKNRESVNILIKPDITGYSAASFDSEAAKELMKRGEFAARKMLPQLIRLRDSLGLTPVVKIPRELTDEEAPFLVDKIEVEGTAKINIVSYLGKMDIGKDKKTNIKHIRQGVAKIYATGNYVNVDYRIYGGEKKTIHITVKETSSNRINVGVHYDTDLKAAALINTTFYSDRISGSNLSIDARLSTSPIFSARYSLDRGWKPGFTTALSFISDRLWLYKDKRKVSDISVQLANFQLATQMVISDAVRLSLGGSLDYYHFGNIIGAADTYELKDSTFFNYFAKITLDELDKPDFPQKGWAIDGLFKVVTDNGWRYNDKVPVGIIGLNIKGARQISDRFVFLPSFTTQFTIGSTPPLYYRSFVGGFQKTNYFGTYLPFAGLRRMELIADKVVTIRFDLRVRMWQKVYLSLITNYGLYGNQVSPFINGNYMIGGGLAIAYESVVGPIEINFCTSNLNSDITPFFSLGYSF